MINKERWISRDEKDYDEMCIRDRIRTIQKTGVKRMIRLENVSKEYKNGVHALRDINPVSYTHLIGHVRFDKGR